LWGKGILCLLVAIFTSLSLFFCVASFSFSSISFFEGGCGFEALFKRDQKCLSCPPRFLKFRLSVTKVNNIIETLNTFAIKVS
jgi:hypothetical protein